MPKGKAAFDAVCPHCGGKVHVMAERENVAGGQVRVPAMCERCLTKFEATTALDCLAWDDACTSEIGRLA